MLNYITILLLWLLIRQFNFKINTYYDTTHKTVIACEFNQVGTNKTTMKT